MTTRTEWIADARRVPVKEVAAAFRMNTKRSRITPCPACRDSVDKRRPDRGPVGVYKGGLRWICNNCKAAGGSVDFAMYRLHGKQLDPGDAGFAEVRSWFADQSWTIGEIREAVDDFTAENLKRPPEDEIRLLLRSSYPSNRVRRRDVLRWFDRKGYRPGDVPCFVLPVDGEFEYRGLTRSIVDTDAGPKRLLWWTLNKAKSFPIAIPAYDHDGRIVNLRGRSLTDRPDKQRAATGFDSVACVMADPWQALKILRGQPVNVSAVVFAEGETDFLTFAQSCKRDPSIAVFGIFSGATPTLKQITDAGKWPEGADFISVADPDDSGRRYTAKIAAALDPLRVKAVPTDLFKRAVA